MLHAFPILILACYADRHNILLILSKRICRTAHAGRPTVEKMGVEQAIRRDELIRCVGMIFNGTFVPVIPLPQNHFETSGKT